MRREELYLLADDLVRSAVLQKLTLIGEAAAHLSADLREHHPEIAWTDIIGFRNIAIHSYFSIDWNIVWIAATQDAPSLRNQIVQIIDREFPPQT